MINRCASAGAVLACVAALLVPTAPASARSAAPTGPSGPAGAAGVAAPTDPATARIAMLASADETGCDSAKSNGDGTTTYTDTTPPNALAATWTPPSLRVVPKGTPTTRLLVRFLETCSGVADATAVIRNLRNGKRFAVDLDLYTFEVKTGHELWVVHLTSTPADAGDWIVQSVAARDISRRFTVNDATGAIVGTPLPGNPVTDPVLSSGIQQVRRATTLLVNAAPEPVKKGKYTYVHGVLQHYTGAWTRVAKARVVVVYRAAGATKYRPLRVVHTDKYGRFRVPAKMGTTTLVFRAVYAGTVYDAGVWSNADAVGVKP